MDAEKDCGDNSCLYAVNKGGMRTNGGCRCDDCPSCGSTIRPGLPSRHKTWCTVVAREEGRREGYAECQRDVETLLSKGRTPGGEAITSARHAAEVIKRGDHVGAAKGGDRG